MADGPRPHLRDAVEQLTRAERRVFCHRVRNRGRQEIARLLDIAVATVDKHLAGIYRKCDVRGGDELMFRAGRCWDCCGLDRLCWRERT